MIGGGFDVGEIERGKCAGRFGESGGFEFRIGRRVGHGKAFGRLCPAEREHCAVIAGNFDRGDARGRDVEDAAIEPIDDLAPDLERAARQPGAVYTGLTEIDGIVARPEPVDAALADDQFGDGLPDAIVELEVGCLAVGRIVQVEAREQFRALGLRLDKRQIS